MFCVNDTVMYGNSGVCTIVDIRPEKFGKEEIMYYILKPVYQDKSTIYCPVNSNKLKIRKLLTKQEAYDLIRIMPNTEAEWVENDHQRKERFTKILKDGDQQDLVKLIKTLYFMREEKAKEGKKPHAVDERIMKEAEGLLYEELAYVLHIKPNEVVPFIVGGLESEARL